MLVVKAGRDANAGINESIDRFQAAATELHADVRVVTNPEAAHGFDVGPRTARARAILRETLRFLQARLARPLPVTKGCATKPERASALRFFAVDDTPLEGVVLGSGPRGVVLAHASDGSFCEWLPYARDLAAAGYRVLAYDSRSGGPPRPRHGGGDRGSPPHRVRARRRDGLVGRGDSGAHRKFLARIAARSRRQPLRA